MKKILIVFRHGPHGRGAEQDDARVREAGQAVIDQVLRVDHPAGFEPGPFTRCPVQITAGPGISGRPLMQPDGHLRN